MLAVPPFQIRTNKIAQKDRVRYHPDFTGQDRLEREIVDHGPEYRYHRTGNREAISDKVPRDLYQQFSILLRVSLIMRAK